MSGATYSIELWDHEMKPEGGWSGELAREHFEGPNEGLSWREIGSAIRTLRGTRRGGGLGWSEYTMYVERENT